MRDLILTQMTKELIFPFSYKCTLDMLKWSYGENTQIVTHVMKLLRDLGYVVRFEPDHPYRNEYYFLITLPQENLTFDQHTDGEDVKKPLTQKEPEQLTPLSETTTQNGSRKQIAIVQTKPNVNMKFICSILRGFCCRSDQNSPL